MGAANGPFTTAGDLIRSRERSNRLKQQIAALPLPEKAQLAAFLSEQLRQAGDQISDAKRH